MFRLIPYACNLVTVYYVRIQYVFFTVQNGLRDLFNQICVVTLSFLSFFFMMFKFNTYTNLGSCQKLSLIINKVVLTYLI